MSAIIAGITMGILGGSKYNIIGPTGSLTSFMQNCCHKYGISSLPYFAMAVGIYTFLLRMYSLEKFIDLFPVPVNEGFTLGIALVMMIGQINNVFGIGPVKVKEYIKENNEIEKIISIEEAENEDNLLNKLIDHLGYLGEMKTSSFFIFLLFFISLYFLLKKYPTIPWMIIMAIVGVLFGFFFKNLDTLKTKFGDLSFVLMDFNYLKFKPIYLLIDIRLWIDAIPIAFVVNLETLISAKIADSMTNTRFHKKRELMALFASNFISGLLGGFPVSGALARTALNIKSGATHKYSAGIGSVVMLFLSAIFMPLISYLPLPVVGAQVCIVAIRMINFESLSNMYYTDNTQFMNAAAIGIICCLKDPITACVFGMLIYLALFCENLMTPWAEIIASHERDNFLKETEKLETEDDELTKGFYLSKNSKQSAKSLHEKILETLENHLCDVPVEEGDYVIYRIIGIINFMNVNEHVEKIRALASKENSTLVISLRYMHFIDIDALHAIKLIVEKVIRDFKKIEEENAVKGIVYVKQKIIISGISRSKLSIIKNEEWIQNLASQNALIFNDKSAINRPSLLKVD